MMQVLVAGLLTCLLWGGHAYAMATYDYFSDAKITFSLLWGDFTTTVTPSSSGTGQHNESTASFQAFDLQNYWYYQSVRGTGSAGDAALSQSGTSAARNDFYTLFTFDFGSTPTDFTMTYTDYNQDVNSSTQLPWNGTGEYVGGSTGTQLLFDDQGGPWYTKGQPNTFHNLAGQHTVRLWTGTESTAIAQYPYVAPEPSPTLLLGLGLVGFAGIRRRIK